jgi:tRNA(Ile)-lysidine synthase TilS/MesJ
MKAENKTLSVQYCTRCALPATFPGITFNAEGVCNFCLNYKGLEVQAAQKAEYSKKFDVLINEHRGRSAYDALMCYSGGKDSTYTLAILKEKYHLNVLSVAFDNGFLPDRTMKNINNVVENLGVDHMMFKPRFDVLARIFSYCADHDVYPLKALERSSAICTACMGIIKYTALRIALEKNIPFIAYGWSPGQAPISSAILKNLPAMMVKMQATVYDPLFKIVGHDIDPYFPDKKYYDGLYQLPYNINPMAFLDYDIDAIYRDVARLGWKKPEDVDANSTNCQLNSYADYVHRKHLKFHPYACELANLVRSGNLDRDTAIERLEAEEDPAIVNMVHDRLDEGKKL